MEWRIAKIDKAVITYEDHGFLTIWLHLSYDGSGQGFGGYALGHRDWDKDGEKTQDSAQELYRWITEIMRVLGVDAWHQLEGKTIMALADWGKVHGIRSLFGDREFFPEGKPEEAPAEMAIGE